MQLTWAQATPQWGGPQANGYWTQGLEAAGCTPPLQFASSAQSDVGLAVTTCPETVLDIPMAPALSKYSYADLELGCNSCYPDFPAAGSVRLAWAPIDANPGGCRVGTCDGLSE
jgi:hypothetical protein